MTSFVQLGLAAIAAFTAITVAAIIMQAKERMHTRRQDDHLALQREAMAHNRRSVREAIHAYRDENDG